MTRQFPVNRLGDYVKIRTGKLDANANDPNGEFPFFTCAIEPLQISSHSYDCECVLVAGNGDLNVKYYDGKFDAYQRTYIIESAEKQTLDVRYLFHFMERYVHQLRTMSIGGVIKYIKLEYLTDAKIPLPPLSEQKRIAGILDQADGLRRKRQQALSLTDQFLRSTFLDLFGDPVTNPKQWPVERLDDIASVNRGKFTPRPRNDPRYYDGPYPFIQTGDLSNCTGVLRTWKQTLNDAGIAVSRQFPKGTIAVAIAANIGDTAILGFDAYMTDSVVGIEVREDKAVADYVEFWFRYKQQELKDRAPETAQKNINLEVLRPLLVPIPPLDDQRRFAGVVRGVDELDRRNHVTKQTADNLFNSLVQQAFRGEL
jgi:type I restriction enzyme, S subunit